MTSERFAQRMRAISRNDRNANEQAVALMVEALEGAGYCEGVAAWRALRLQNVSQRELDEAVSAAEEWGEARVHDELRDRLSGYFSDIRTALDRAEVAV